MTPKRALILDLDYTLLHLEAVPGSIEVPGRTRSAWIAPPTVEALRDLTEHFDLVLATARSWDGTRWVSQGLAACGVPVAAAIMEDGALILAPRAPQVLVAPAASTSSADVPPDARPLEAWRDWAAIREEVESRREAWWPAFEWQRDFVACLVARAASPGDAAILMDAWTLWLRDFNTRAGESRALRLFRDGRKLYAIGARADKWAALKYLLGARADEAAGVGDGANDACWLSRVVQPCTMPHAAPPILELVRNCGGFVSARDGHTGIVEVLRFLGDAST